MNMTWARRWLRSFSSTDAERLIAMYTPDARFEDVTLKHTLSGKPNLKRFFAGFMNAATRRNSFTCLGYSGNSSGGAVEWKWRAHHLGTFMGISAAGKVTTIRGVSVITFRRGKVATQHDYWDARALIQQLRTRSAKRAGVAA